MSAIGQLPRTGRQGTRAAKSRVTVDLIIARRVGVQAMARSGTSPAAGGVLTTRTCVVIIAAAKASKKKRIAEKQSTQLPTRGIKTCSLPPPV